MTPAAFMGMVTPVPESGCWLWDGRLTDRGYGASGRRGKAHRRAWEIFRGPIPSGQCVCHACDVRPCVNPAHLFLGTHADNNRDAARKGRTVNPRGELHGRSKLTAEQVAAIRSEYRPGVRGLGFKALGGRYGVSHTTVERIVAGRLWPVAKLPDPDIGHRR